MSNSRQGSSSFINAAPDSQEPSVPGDKKGLVPSTLNASPVSAGSDAFVAPPGQQENPTGLQGTDREADDLARYDGSKPKRPSETGQDTSA